MINGKDFHFLKEKIYELNTAIFISKSDAVLKFPTSIVSVLKVDDIGQLWFFISKPKQNVSEFEKAFVSEMDFFRKGKSFYLQIDGKAFIVNDPEEINCLMDLPEDVKLKALNELVLMKFRITKVNYFESRKSASMHGIEKIKETFNHWIFNQRPGFRPYRLQQDNLAY